MQFDVPGTLKELSRLVDRLAELAEWRRLAQSEQRRPFLTSFELDQHLDEDMLDLQIRFADLAFFLRELLNRPDLDATPEQRQHWLRELESLEARAARLVVSEKLKTF